MLSYPIISVRVRPLIWNLHGQFVEPSLAAAVEPWAALKNGTDAMKLSCEALKAHRDWVCAGKPVDDDGSRRLNKKGQLCDCEVSPADCGHHGGVEVERLQLNEEVRRVAWRDCAGYELG